MKQAVLLQFCYPVNFLDRACIQKCTFNHWSGILEHTNRKRRLFKKIHCKKPLIHYFSIDCYTIELNADCPLHFCHFGSSSF